MPKVDLSHYEGREPSYIKHYLIEKYLPDFAYKVGSSWKSLAYIDGFAGPWQTRTPDHSDSSFAVAVNELQQCQRGLRQRGRELKMQCILVDHDKSAFTHLEKFAQAHATSGFEVHALTGDFVQNIPEIERLIKTYTPEAFRFVFLDPKGWADIPMLKLKLFLQGRPCEVLVNLMTKHILRFLDEPNREPSYNDLFARTGVLATLRQPALRNAPAYVRPERAVREYGLSLKLLCNFKYISSAVLLEPEEEGIRYFLVYASNHPRGVEVFKAAENKAAKLQDSVRHETHIQKTHQPPLMFDDSPPPTRLAIQLRDFYSSLAKTSVLQLFSTAVPRQQFPYSAVFCEAMTFPLVKPTDLVTWLAELRPHVEVLLANATSRKPSPLRDDRVMVVNPSAVRTLCRK